jgi:DNA-binding PucR family transcriptional regulator
MMKFMTVVCSETIFNQENNMQKAWIFFLCLIAAACSTSRDTEKDREEINSALTSPLKDLNLIREKIPDVLLAAEKNPYAIPLESDCKNLESEIDALDKVLAPDIDQKTKTETGIVQSGVEAIGDASLDAIRRTTESVIPYRSWVRKLTGAERSSKLVGNAIRAGNLRRAFLKGLRVKSCSEKL